MKFNWEVLQSYDGEEVYVWTQRAKVIGGWIVKHLWGNTEGVTSSMVFVPDIHHDWKID